MAQRFSLESTCLCPECGTEHETPVLLPDEYGDYVDYLNYERLEEENRELKETINRLERKNEDD